MLPRSQTFSKKQKSEVSERQVPAFNSKPDKSQVQENMKDKLEIGQYDQARGYRTQRSKSLRVSQNSQYPDYKSQIGVSQLDISYQPPLKQYSEKEMDSYRNIIENMWDYRYWRIFDYAVKSKDWMPLYAFIGQYKLKCIALAKQLVEENFLHKEIDRIDHRYELRGEGELGIYLIDGIILRVAKVKRVKDEFDKRAEKNLHQEFISYNIVNDLIISLASEIQDFPTMRVPITCLVKFMGYTFLCQGDTMCNGIQTLIYGPMGSTFKYQENVSGLLNTIGQHLNLKPFKVVTVNKNIIQIPFCLTVELHQINSAFRDQGMIKIFNPDSILYPNHQKDNKLIKPQFYLLSFSKLWPLFIDSNIVKSSGYLRPEAVLLWKKQLSNAVFSNIAFEKDEQGELQLAEACKSIKQQNIKDLATFLDEATFFVFDSVSIEQIMHHYKINMRFLGLVASKFTLASNKRVFEVEMVARILKKIFYTSFEIYDETKVKENITKFLNIIFNLNASSQKFFMSIVYPRVKSYYDYDMNEYPPIISGGGLLHSLSFHLGVKIKLGDYAFFKSSDNIFSDTHIMELVSQARSFMLETCPMKKTCQKYKAKKKDGLQRESVTKQVISELNILANIFRLSCPEGTYSVNSAPQSYYYAELAEVYRSKGEFETTNKYAQLSLKGIPERHADAIKAYCIIIRYHSWKKQTNRCLQYYEKSLATLSYHLHHNHPLSISVYNTLGYQFLSTSDPSKCQKIFAKSFEICEQALGYMHSTSGKILLQLADLPLPPQKTINFLLQALTILQNIETDKQKIQSVCMKISEMYFKIGNLTKMIQFARRSSHWKMQIIAREKLNENKVVLQLCSRPATGISLSQLQFLVQKSFSAYIKLLDHYSSYTLYKVFVSLVDHLPDQAISTAEIHEKLTKETSISLSVVQFVKSSLNNLLMQIPDLLKRPQFFMGPSQFEENKQNRDQRLKNNIHNYQNILSIVGAELGEKIFTEIRKRN